MTLVYVIISLLCLAAIAKLYQMSKIAKARREGIYPSMGKVTKEDISRLALSGERVLAIFAYRELYGCGLKQAKKEIDAIHGN